MIVEGKGNMERLTSNKDIQEMSMYELAHNSCYVEGGDYIQRYIIAWNEDSLEWSAECVGDPEGTLPLSEFRVGEIEVIGNIFDNPELLRCGTAE